ncbi:MAG: hypothetical protein DHS20C03_38180 [Minwuia thermotolerans]|nr:MAG: hypothetical protein DHS20C03_38180 [Minwuia thermotolerans]
MAVLHLSFGELSFYCCRAAFGAGLSWGLAEDVAVAAVWLARQGRDPAPLLAAALVSLTDGAAEPSVKHEQSEIGTVLMADGKKPLSALVSGPSAADWWQVMKQDPAARLGVRNVDVPGWVIACIAARTGDGSTGTRPSDGPGDVVMSADGSGTRPSGETAHADHVTVDPDAWAIVQRHFRLSLVPSTDASRSAGAGAGLVDTD